MTQRATKPKRRRQRRPKPIWVHQLPPKIPEPERRATDHGFAWLWFLTLMNQAQVDALRFGVNPHDDSEWASFVQWYELKWQKPPQTHVLGTVFPLSPEELRDRLRNH